MSAPLRDSLVCGWREVLDLGTDLPEVDHLVDSPSVTEAYLEVLRSTLRLETNLRRLCCPLPTPIRDGRWFTNTWVSPYFEIPDRTPPDHPQRWRLIHHLSYHVSGKRSSSVNGHVDLEEFPTVFPTHLTAAHLIF